MKQLNLDHEATIRKVDMLLAECGQQSNSALLLGADMSGIQSYLYQIVDSDALKNLKGRSFYLRILPDAIARYILSKLELSMNNLLYNSAGGFYMLIPNTDKIKEILEETIAEIEERLFNFYHDKLYMSIAYVEVELSELRNTQTLKSKWDELFVLKDKKKKSRYSSLLKVKYSDIFEPINTGGNIKIDIMTGEEILGKVVRNKNGDALSESSAEQIKLGECLRMAKGMLISQHKYSTLGEESEFEPLGLGVYYYILSRSQFEDCLINKRGELLVFNEQIPKCKTYFYGGASERVETISDLLGDKDKEFRKLGVVRLDVDNLGYIFQNSGNNSSVPFARTIALSGQLDEFFSGYVPSLLTEELKKNISIVYCGGDDVFYIGEWSSCIEYAKIIRTEFDEFVKSDSTYSLSGGISIVSEKFPLLKAAELSGEQEEMAKEHICKGQEKNSICILDFPLNWQCEYPFVEELKNELVSLRTCEYIPSALLQYIMRMYKQANITNHVICNYQVYWLLAYGVKRILQNNVDIEIVKNLTNDITNNRTLNGKTITTDYHMLELWAIACRWAELEIRRNLN